MRNSHRGRMVVVAVLASLAALVSMASPAPAATVNTTWDISGTITTHWDGVTRKINDPAGTTICVPAGSGQPAVVIHSGDATGTHVPLHVNGASAYSGFDPADINIAGTNYQAQITGAAGTTTGTLNFHTGTVSMAVNLHAAIKNCAGTTTLCTFTVSLTLTGHTYTGTSVPSTGNTVTVSGSAANPINPAIGCNVAIRPTILNSTVSGTIHLLAH